LTVSPGGVLPSALMSSRRPWTNEELSQLEHLAKANLSLQVIALKLGRSAAAVDAKAAQLRIALRRMKRRYQRKATNPEGSADRNRVADSHSQ
jgi:hypothetical protein